MQHTCTGLNFDDNTDVIVSKSSSHARGAEEGYTVHDGRDVRAVGWVGVVSKRVKTFRILNDMFSAQAKI